MKIIKIRLLMNSLAQNSVTQTTTTTTMASANVSTTTAVRTASNGRATSKQEVIHLRANQPSREAPFGELWDNEICWGGCSQLGTILTKSSVVFMGDGTFASELAFARMWQKEKTGLEERYTTGSNSLLGKYDQGATDSVTVLGNKAATFHNFNGVVKKTVYDVGAYQRSGVIPENIQDASPQEVDDFLAHMKLLTPDYSLESFLGGTMIKVESLERQNTQKTFDKVVKFTKGLYRPSCTTAPIHLFNWLHQEWPEDISTGKVTVTPIDITFGAEVFSVTVNVYQLENGDVSHSVHPAADEKLGEYTINWWFPNKQQKLAEKAFYGHTSDTERVGFSGFRAGRNITHTPKIWGLPLYQDRARGIRLCVEVPASDWADKEFGIGTQKILTNDSWSHFNETMRDLFTEKFKDLQIHCTRAHKNAQKRWQKKYETKLTNIDNFTKESAEEELGVIGQDFDDSFDKEDGIIKKRSGNAYKAWKNYRDALLAKIAESSSEEEEEEEEEEEDPDYVPEEEESDCGSDEDELEEEVVEDDNLSLSQAATDIIENDDTLTGGVNNVNVANSNVMEEGGGESKTSSEICEPPSHEDLIAEIQAGVGELIARMKETHPESSSYLDSCHSILSTVW